MGIAEDLEIFDSKIARLKVEYEQYFMRVLKREPVKLRGEVEKVIIFYSNKNFTNTSYKFKFNSLVAKYNSYKQYWTRVLREIEEGTFKRTAEGGAVALPKTPPQVKTPVQEPRAAKPAVPEAAKKPADQLDEVYRLYIEKRKECNEPVTGITKESLEKTIEKYKAQVEERYKTKDVDLKVYVQDGKTKLTITPKSKPK